IYSVRYDGNIFKTLATLPCPVVVMESESPELARRTKDLVVIQNDADESAKAAARTFSEMGRYRSFAYVGDRQGQEWSERREAAFIREVAARTGSEVQTYDNNTSSAEADLPPLMDFLSKLEHPAAVLAANDMRAAEVISAAKESGIAVPTRIAVLGIDNDPYVCDGVSPGISSIEPDFHAEGRAAAELLDKMIRSRFSKESRHVFFGVKRVVLRESTPHLPPAERLVARARDFIEKHATDGIAPADVAAHLGVSRPLLDLRFRETQKTTVGQLITATKLGEVARRLRETKLSISAIQETCGFRNANALKNLFKSRYGVSMRDYRRRRDGTS
ncbi:MAG: substrate-binding domain-containing protein, partial [Kiritimatiellae bacterium]|nr:substrate-binding domain-containing protein [Kiritimatiellia bacterium]